MKHLIFIFLSFFSFTGIGQELNPVTFSFESGVYTTAISIQLTNPEPGAQIYYTLNGSEPTLNDILYTVPFSLINLDGQVNNYSSIPTNPSFNYPLADYTTIRANNRGWLPPFSEVQKAHIVKAKAFKTGFTESKSVTKTYLIDVLGEERYTFPIVSVVMDSVDLFSNATGIYVYGDHPNGNYTQKEELWERPMHIDYIENGTLTFNRNTRTRLHGGGSRHSGKKNFRIYAETDENSNFNHPFFDDYELDKFKRIILRSGGHRPDCFPRDDLSQSLAEGVNIEHQHYKHVIVFVNGEYWGIHSIKERVDTYFIQNTYGIDDDMITMLDQEYDVQGNGYAVDSTELKTLQDFIVAEDMSIQTNYEQVVAKIDVDNYIDYMCTEIYLSNADWVYSNVVIWRKTGAYDPGAGPGLDGRFRWLMYDLDGGFGGSCDNAYYTVNTLNAATITSGIFASYSRFFRGLLENIEFRDKFINRSCDLLNSWYKPAVVKQKMNEMYAILTPEMLENVDRWRYPSEADNLADRQFETPNLVQWDTTFYYLNRFAGRRDRKFRDHVLLKWNLSDTSYVTANVNDVDMGFVKVNSLLLNQNIPGVSTTVYPWTGIYINDIALPIKAIAKPGYKFVEWLETGNTTTEIVWTPNGDSIFTAIFEIDTEYNPIVINEVMLKNKDFLADNFNDYDDWTELFNPNNYEVDLSSCKIIKGGSEWIIPNGTIIPANDYLIFWNDEETYQGNNHINFKLQNVADYIFLKSPTNETIDSLGYQPTSNNESFGRYPNGTETTQLFTYPTPKQNNDVSGIEDVYILQKLIAYPNPSTDVILFNKKISFTIFDLMGREIVSLDNQFSLDVSNFENGIYILQSTNKETIKISVKK
jgi:hypothetical protein